MRAALPRASFDPAISLSRPTGSYSYTLAAGNFFAAAAFMASAVGPPTASCRIASPAPSVPAALPSEAVKASHVVAFASRPVRSMTVRLRSGS